MIPSMDKSNKEQFYDTYRWFARFFKHINTLLSVISNCYQLDEKSRYYQKAKEPLLPDPFCVSYAKANRQQEWKNVHLVSVCCPNEVLRNADLKSSINEPALIVIVTSLQEGPSQRNLHWHAIHILNYTKYIKRFNVNGDSFSGYHNRAGDFKGFFVPLYAFSKQALEKKSQEKNTTLEQALDDTIDELIVKRLEKLLNER